MTVTNDEIIALLRSRLDDKRFEHSLCVARSAVELSKIYKADEQKTYIAGLLHDITKNMPVSEQRTLIESAGITLDFCEDNNENLLHAISAPVFVKNELDIYDEDILMAIRYHTTGRAGMGILEKIIYIADFISDDRNYPGVDEMRDAAKLSLDKAVLISLEFCIPDWVKKSKLIHTDSVELYNETLSNRRKK